MDRACKEHDIAYSKNKDLAARHKADRILEDKAWSRVKAKDASLGEKAASWVVTNAMKAKRKLGMGMKKQHTKHLNFNKHIIGSVRNVLKHYKGGEGVRVALRAARIAIKKAGGRKRIKVPRIIPLPKKGGILPLLPILAGLGALGSLAGGAAGIVRAVNKTKEAQRQLDETKRHNETMEAIALGGNKKKKTGGGLFLKPYRKGLGLYIRPYSKN